MTAPHATAPRRTGPVEIELKLVATAPLDPDAVLAVARRLGAVEGTPVVTRLDATYYDTPGHDLQRRKAALRVRREGDALVQTLKTAGSRIGPATHRGEWNWPLPTDRLDLLALQTATTRGVLEPGLALADLAPVFRTDIQRTALLLDVPDARIELAVDIGHIAAGRRRRRVAELELELKHGAAAALARLALALVEHLPVALSLPNKATRGYALARGEPLAPVVKARPVALASAAPTVGEALGAILGSGLEQLLGNEPGARLGQVGSVHQMRVALRRLRSAVLLAPSILEDPEGAALIDELRWLAGVLGDARDLDVLLETTLPPLDPPAPLLRALRRERRRRGAALKAALATPRYARLTLALALWIERGLPGLDQPLKRSAAAMLERRWRRAAGVAGRLSQLPPEQRHDFRKRMKKLRYIAEFVQTLFPIKRTRAFLEALESLQDGLGALNDAAVARALLQGQHGADAVLLKLDAMETASLDAIAQGWTRVLACKPFWR